jgi:hypothetical protein
MRLYARVWHGPEILGESRISVVGAAPGARCPQTQHGVIPSNHAHHYVNVLGFRRGARHVSRVAHRYETPRFTPEAAVP